jgi:hypothetical protein
MAKTPIPLQANDGVKIRATVSAIDTGPFTDASYDVSAAGVAQPMGYRKVLLWLVFHGGTTPSAQVQLLHRIAQGNVAGGSGWVQGVQSVALYGGQAFFVDVMGRDFFPLITSLTGTPTSVDIWCAGWESYRNDGPRGA